MNFDFKNNIKPTDDHILVEPEKPEMMTKSGLYIPATVTKERPQIGNVIAVGPGKMTDDGKRLPMDVKAGDKILFSKYGPSEIKTTPAWEQGGEELLILNQSDVLAVIIE